MPRRQLGELLVFGVRVSEDRPTERENLQQGLDGGKLCPGHWVPGRKQGLISLWVLSLPFPRLEEASMLS